ncbi:tetratricopeptide repeat protein [Geitlerinema sp. P-1104]|uniref:tetratricopeptide repeat protein n=1 Tax=Geitlerinema sp. P-1104 TaxID=2546230 RepID=UPI0014772CB1|nr:tetratricopeptide repeat protein [Geitlerinema sp. P-1104]NMG60498.1 tetratricopeptide repeat protein [Geitlerinema sp. P-1104]
MDSNLALFYLATLVGLLAIAAWFVIRQTLRTRRMEKTLSTLQSRVRSKDATAKDFYELGGVLLDKKLYSQAILQLQKAIKAKDLKEDENKALVYNALGFAYAAQEQYDLAIRQYKEALKLTPDYTTAWSNLGFSYEKKGLDAAALEAYQEVLQRDPDNAVAKKRSESLQKRLPATSGSNS